MTSAPQVEVEQHHTSLRVADFCAAVEFYTTCLGFSSRWPATAHGSFSTTQCVTSMDMR